MEKLKITGGQKLFGEVEIRAAKNAVLPILACCLLTKKEVVLHNVPHLVDIDNMLSILKSMGAKVSFKKNTIVICCLDATPSLVSTELTGALRSSIFILGPVLARFKKIQLGLPGGCAIGARPIDIHLKALRDLNAAVIEEDGYIECDSTSMQGGATTLAFPSVGATENLIMAAVFNPSLTIIKNAAREPEIVDLANFINFLGGRVHGAGTSMVVVEGVREFFGGDYQPIGDRIVAPTVLGAVAMTRGKVTVKDVNPLHFTPVLDIFDSMGCKVKQGKNYVELSQSKKLRAVEKIITRPYPDFPTDMQAQIVAALSLANGNSIVKETIFENRFSYVKELEKMGAEIVVENNKAIISGVEGLHGAEVYAEDLRGGAALVMAALAANGQSVVRDVRHIDRGYEKIEKMFGLLGAKIERVP